MPDSLSEILETTQPERLATGFEFTEGPLWDPAGGFYYFVDLRRSRLYRLTPGKEPEVVRENTGGGNGTTFDLQGRIVICEGENRRVTRIHDDGQVVVLAGFESKRLNRPNDVICRSDGSIYFTDLGGSLPLPEWELPFRGVYRVRPDGAVALVAHCEAPNGLAFSPDERVLYVANTRFTPYIHALELDAAGSMVRRRIFAGMSSDETDGVVQPLSRPQHEAIGGRAHALKVAIPDGMVLKSIHGASRDNVSPNGGRRVAPEPLSTSASITS